tara:strand:+ start:32 stop:439 length:408 start_codon:yes stop_codon:yes gene_type:complete
MNFIDAVKNYFFKWNDFKSRSSRSEYWWATVFVTIATYPVAFIIGFLIGAVFSSAGLSEIAMEVVIGIVILTLNVFISVATISLVVRRLHDVDRSGWWYLIIFTIIGVIPLLIWLCIRGTNGDNRFGKNPLEQLH